MHMSFLNKPLIFSALKDELMYWWWLMWSLPYEDASLQLWVTWKRALLNLL